MHLIQPLVHTYDDALAYLAEYGRPGATFFDAYPQSLSLSGGSVRHPITISLTYASHGEKIFGHYTVLECYRLVIRDGLYRTKYALDPDEHARLKQDLIAFIVDRGLRVAVRSTITSPEYLDQAAREFFAGSDVRWKVGQRSRPPEESLTLIRSVLNAPPDRDVVDFTTETIAGLMEEILHLRAFRDRVDASSRRIEASVDRAAASSEQVAAELERLRMLIIDYARTPMTFNQFLAAAFGEDKANELMGISDEQQAELLELWHDRLPGDNHVA